MIGFRPLEESDLPQVEVWLRAEHVAEWWRDPLEVALEKRREALEGRREVEHYVILEDDRPVGLLQTYRVGDYPEWGETFGFSLGFIAVCLALSCWRFQTRDA